MNIFNANKIKSSIKLRFTSAFEAGVGGAKTLKSIIVNLVSLILAAEPPVWCFRS